MPKILIVAEKKDAHTRIVIDALKKKGISPLRWSPNEYLHSQKSNFYINSDGKPLLTIVDLNTTLDLNEIDVVWFRRPKYPSIPKNIHLDDRNFVRIENMMHMRSLWLTLGESATWINPYYSYDKCNSKIYQLREAARIGLMIPETLITNDRERILDFIHENKADGVIYKTFSPPHWEEEGEVFCFQTTLVTADIVPQQSTIQLTPGIYQKSLKKAFEVRVTFFGDHYVAVKIHNTSEFDWRPLSEKLLISPTTLPAFIEKQCVALMKELNIIFGCFDFIVTSSGDYVFLEVNEMGQFLWIEERLPELKLLNTFCEFLLSFSKPPAIQTVKVEMQKISSSSTYTRLLRDDTEQQKLIDECLEPN